MTTNDHPDIVRCGDCEGIAHPYTEPQLGGCRCPNLQRWRHGTGPDGNAPRRRWFKVIETNADDEVTVATYPEQNMAEATAVQHIYSHVQAMHETLCRLRGNLGLREGSSSLELTDAQTIAAYNRFVKSLKTIKVEQEP